ncbi:cell division protein ZapA [bacterium]|nr:MAG: cell division protein ZapA [bacterium]
MKNTGIKVKIFNSDYNLLGDNPAEVEKFAKYVDGIMQRINYQSPNTSVESIAVVSALNIAESFYKEKDSRLASEKDYYEFLNESIKKIDDLSDSVDKAL